MFRRDLLVKLAALPVVSLLAAKSSAQSPTEPKKRLNIMMKTAWGSDDPTRGSFAFAHGLALAEAGHNVQIFLTGEATGLMRKATLDDIFPVGWPPLSETLQKVVAKHIPIFA